MDTLFDREKFQMDRIQPHILFPGGSDIEDVQTIQGVGFGGHGNTWEISTWADSTVKT